MRRFTGRRTASKQTRANERFLSKEPTVMDLIIVRNGSAHGDLRLEIILQGSNEEKRYPTVPSDQNVLERSSQSRFTCGIPIDCERIDFFHLE